MLLLPFLPLYSQNDTIENNINLQSLIEESSNEEVESQIFESIEDLINNPIDINTATIDQLMQIPFLDFNTARAIIDYKNTNGNFNSLNELYRINKLNDQIIEKIIPFLKIENKNKEIFSSIKNVLINGKLNFRTRIINNFQTPEGFLENKYSGSKQKLYSRLLFISDNYFRAGFISEKDAGEKSYLDYYSFHLQLKEVSFISNLTFGDYNIEFGQGLALWSPYSYSKGIDAVNFVNKNPHDIKLNTGTNENKFLRGVAFNINLKSLRLTPFFSKNYLDASLDSTTNKINSLITDGYHRTKTEETRKNNVEENIVGISSEYSINNNKFGILYYNSKLNHEFDEHKFFISSRSNDYYSFSYSTFIKQLNISGELTYHNSLIATINNILISIGKNLSLIFSFRNYPEKFFSMHGYSFGEKSYVQNEAGFYSGINFSTALGNFNIYYDQFRYFRSSNSLAYSLKGYEFLLFYDYKPFKQIEIRFKYKIKKKEEEVIIDNFTSLQPFKNENIRIEVLFNQSNKLKLRTRIESIMLKRYNFANEEGLLLFEDIQYKLKNNFYLNGRIVFFKTDSYDSRIYEYENDLTGLVTIPALYGEGMRWYVLLKYKTNLGLNISVKYSELFKPNEKNLGSGYNLINKNLDNGISLQLDLMF